MYIQFSKQFLLTLFLNKEVINLQLSILNIMDNHIKKS